MTRGCIHNTETRTWIQTDLRLNLNALDKNFRCLQISLCLKIEILKRTICRFILKIKLNNDEHLAVAPAAEEQMVTLSCSYPSSHLCVFFRVSSACSPHVLADFPICLRSPLFPVKISSYSLLYACLSLWNGVFTKLFSLQPSESLSGGGWFLIHSLGNFSATVFRTYCRRIFWNVNLVNHQVWDSLPSPCTRLQFQWFGII